MALSIYLILDIEYPRLGLIRAFAKLWESRPSFGFDKSHAIP